MALFWRTSGFVSRCTHWAGLGVGGLCYGILASVFVSAFPHTTYGQEAESQVGKESSVNAPAPAPTVVVRLNGRDISIDEYASYLVAALGKSKLDEYINRLLVDEEARRKSVQVSPEALESALQTRIDRTVKSLYEGDEQRFEENLRRRRTTRQDYMARWRQTLYYDLLMEQIILKTRDVSEEAIQQQFVAAYGADGVQHVVRHILVVRRPPSAPGVERSAVEMQERAQKILRELDGGLNFAQAVQQYSDDLFTRRNEGRIPDYRAESFGPEFHTAVLKLTKDHPRSGVVGSPHGLHILELVDRRETQFADVKAAVEGFLTARPATPKERQALTEKLRKAAKIEFP